MTISKSLILVTLVGVVVAGVYARSRGRRDERHQRAKARAGAIARGTEGVTRVVNQLVVNGT